MTRRHSWSERYLLFVIVPALILLAAGPLAGVLALAGVATWRKRQHRAARELRPLQTTREDLA